MMASPTAASAAATAMTKKTNTCPPRPRFCASATNVRFTAFSMSSTHMKITIALRRSSTPARSEEHTSELQSLTNLVCRLLLEKKKKKKKREKKEDEKKKTYT